MNNHRQNRLLLLAGMSLVLVMLLFAVSGCDAALDVKGMVYEWVDAPADSNGELYINTEAPANRLIKPVADASVVLSVSSGIKPNLTTDENGTFTWHNVLPAGLPRKVNVQIEKAGYTTITGGFQRDGVNYSLVIFLVRNKEGSSTVTNENSGQISSSQYVFIEHHISFYGEPLDGEYPPVFIDFPGYSFDKNTGTLYPTIYSRLNVTNELDVVFGSGGDISGIGSGVATSLYGIEILPYEYNSFKYPGIPYEAGVFRIIEISNDGTAHLEYTGTPIVLKNGGEWSKVTSTIVTNEHNGQTVRAKLTITDRITNYGILDKSKIVTKPPAR
jgi:hypothetical protein